MLVTPRHRLHRRRGDLRLRPHRATGGARRPSASSPTPSPWPRPSPRPTCRMGALTVPEHVYQALVDESGKHGVFAHGFTYSGHPLACAVALKTIEIYERINIVGARAARGADLPAAAEGAGGSSAGRRGARRRPDRRAGAGERQARQAELRAQARRGRQGRAACRGGRPDVPRGRRRQHRPVPAADHRRRRDQRHVRLLARALDRTDAWARKEGHL